MPKVMGQPFARLNGRIGKFVAAERSARTSAAQTATNATRQAATRTRPQAPLRPGRMSRGLGRGLEWKAGSGEDSYVRFDIDKADRSARYWIVQEIGTGQRATIRQALPPDDYKNRNPVGRPKKGANYVRTVKAQSGRRIHRGLAFGTGPAGRYTRPGAAKNQQIYIASDLQGTPMKMPRIVIRREIKGKGMVKKGAKAGFRQYREAVLTAARRAFGGHPGP